MTTTKNLILNNINKRSKINDQSKNKKQTLFQCCFGAKQLKKITNKKNKNNKSKKKNASLSKHYENIEENIQLYLLSSQLEADKGKKTLVLDLDETLVHSSFDPIGNADFTVQVTIGNENHQVYVKKRPNADFFLQRLGNLYEIIIFTASDPRYANQVIDRIDTSNIVKARLFRDDCVQHFSFFVKDLSLLGRDLKSTIIVDNSPVSYLFHKENAIPIKTWIDDPNDDELLKCFQLLERILPLQNVIHALSSLQK
ncbi:ctd small phosphatase-like protein [Anaeramoeba ignava]|uniref:Ctd small phosphatase-like protein n=1 Tax=Anaeramoeba ignava TaxID=1746090 RepID=A0A9Q0LX85_ANAIG|nr:ctd small phosphatase-like protein [Anaeramoeba ignava]|eukprot:Anaeramoba_ignava/a353737_129.p1 GENE.a353737_129~~a353737_129.p1  ORF type:complete len:263 (+),score=66.16 a353737_129:27-791(+)